MYLRSSLRLLLVMESLLCLPWLFRLLNFHLYTVFFDYAFVVFNAFQVMWTIRCWSLRDSILASRVWIGETGTIDSMVLWMTDWVHLNIQWWIVISYSCWHVIMSMAKPFGNNNLASACYYFVSHLNPFYIFCIYFLIKHNI